MGTEEFQAVNYAECRPGINDIPASVLSAADMVNAWFQEHGVKQWKLGGIQSRDDLPSKTYVHLLNFQADIDFDAQGLAREDRIRSLVGHNQSFEDLIVNTASRLREDNDPSAADIIEHIHLLLAVQEKHVKILIDEVNKLRVDYLSNTKFRCDLKALLADKP